MKSKRIMVVDDDASMRDVLKTGFEEKGYTVFTAETAEDALKILEEESVHVFFLDLQLPGMSGLELIQHVRPDNPISIMFAMTGYVSVFHLVQCREAGFDDYFVKPFSMDLALKVTEQAFEKLQRWRRGK